MLLIDTADKALITEAIANPAVSGFTTNPTLMARAAGLDAIDPESYIRQATELCELPVAHPSIRDVMIQGIGSPDEILAQAKIYRDTLRSSGVATRLWIKLMPTTESFQIIPHIKALGCATLVTAVFTPPQAYMAMEAGADGIAVYVGRLMRAEQMWHAPLELMADIVHIAERTLLLASFPDLATVEQALRYSRDLTVPPAVLQEFLRSPHTADADQKFTQAIAKR